MINQVIWWTGAAAWGLGGLYGLAEGGLWMMDKILKRFGLWPAVYQVMRRYYRERRQAGREIDAG